jgi:hypothetical protein
MLKKSLSLLVSILMAWIIIGCEDFEQKDFQVEGIDMQACSILSDTTVVPVAAGGKNITLYDPTWFGEAVYSNASQIIDALNSDDSDTNVVRQLITGPSLYNAVLPVDTSYLALSSSAGNVVVYTTNWVIIRPIRPDGGVVVPSNLNISMELVFECPDVKFRAEFSDLGSSSLLQIIKGEQFTGSGTKLLILGN